MGFLLQLRILHSEQKILPKIKVGVICTTWSVFAGLVTYANIHYNYRNETILFTSKFTEMCADPHKYVTLVLWHVAMQVEHYC